MKARLQQTKKKKLILHLSFTEEELRKYRLVTGKQPSGAFIIQIHRREKK